MGAGLGEEKRVRLKSSIINLMSRTDVPCGTESILSVLFVVTITFKTFLKTQFKVTVLFSGLCLGGTI